MKKLALLFFISSIIVLCVQNVKAQDYKSSIGVRLGFPLSASFKHFLNEKGAIEASLGTRGYSGFGRYVNINGSYQHHSDLSQVAPNLKWYVGGGAGVNIWSYKSYYKSLGLNTSSTTFSIFGMVGLDYKVPNYPVNLSVDWTPTFFIGDAYFSGFGAGYGSLAVRYILGSN